MKRKITHEIAIAAGLDAGNRSMRKAGRTKWSKKDMEAAAHQYNRVMPRKEGET